MHNSKPVFVSFNIICVITVNISQQECTVRILALDNPLRYVTVNKDGAICIWSSTAVLEQTTYTDPELEEANGQKRRLKVCNKLAPKRNTWAAIKIQASILRHILLSTENISQPHKVINCNTFMVGPG